MLNVFHKHRQGVLWFILIFIGIPFIFMVPGATNNSRSQGEAKVVIEVDGEDVYGYEFYTQFSNVVDDRNKQDLPSGAIDLKNDGTVSQIVERFVQDIIINQKIAQNAVIPENEYLKIKFQDDEYFKNEAGEFVPVRYNDWVTNNDKSGINWDTFYANYASTVNQQAYAKLIQASVRVSESELREEYLKSQRKMKVRYVTIAPEVEVTEEELIAYHADNAEAYMSLPKKTIDYVRFSLSPPVPESILSVLAQARAEGDFAALATEHSVGPYKTTGGDLGWIEVTDTPLGQSRNYMGLAAGEVSEPIRSFSEIYLYKVEEERVNDESKLAEKHVRRIIFRPEVAPEFGEGAVVAADAFLVLVNANGGNLAKAATEAELTVVTSPSFNVYDDEIEGIPANDLSSFRQQMGVLEDEAVAEVVVSGSDYLYVGKHSFTSEPTQQAFEIVRDDVEGAVKATKKQSPAYQEKVNGYIEIINAEIKSLDEIATKFPELTIEIKEPRQPFGARDFLFSEQIFWNTGEVFQQLSLKKAGDLLAPVVDFQGSTFVLELTEIVEPATEVFEKDWAENKENLLASILQQGQLRRQVDYLKFLSEQAQNDGKVLISEEEINLLIGLNKDGSVPVKETEDDSVDEALVESSEGEVPEATEPEATSTPAEN